MIWLLGWYLLMGVLVALRAFSVANLKLYKKSAIVIGFIQLSLMWAIYLPLAMYDVIKERRNANV